MEMKKQGFPGTETGGGWGILPQHHFLCPLQLTKSVSVADPGNEEQGLLSRPAVETCLESLRLLEASPVSNPPSPTDLPEPRGTMEHTNNRIGESACLGGPGVLRG